MISLNTIAQFKAPFIGFRYLYISPLSYNRHSIKFYNIITINPYRIKYFFLCVELGGSLVYLYNKKYNNIK